MPVAGLPRCWVAEVPRHEDSRSEKRLARATPSSPKRSRDASRHNGESNRVVLSVDRPTRADCMRGADWPARREGRSLVNTLKRVVVCVSRFPRALHYSEHGHCAASRCALVTTTLLDYAHHNLDVLVKGGPKLFKQIERE